MSAREEYRIYKRVLLARNDVCKLHRYGLNSTEEADRFLAMMQNGSTPNDALYTIKDTRN